MSIDDDVSIDYVCPTCNKHNFEIIEDHYPSDHRDLKFYCEKCRTPVFMDNGFDSKCVVARTRTCNYCKKELDNNKWQEYYLPSKDLARMYGTETFCNNTHYKLYLIDIELQYIFQYEKFYPDEIKRRRTKIEEIIIEILDLEKKYSHGIVRKKELELKKKELLGE